MDTTNQPAATVMGRLYGYFSGNESATGTPAARLLLILALAILMHLTVKTIRSVSEWLISKSHAQRKIRSASSRNSRNSSPSSSSSPTP